MSEKTIELKLPLVLIRTRKGLGLIEWFSRRKIVKALNWLWVLFVPLLTIGAFYLMVGQIIWYFTDAKFLGLVKEGGPQGFLMIPGLNPLLPVFSGWIALIIAVTIHELSHGVAARSVGVDVRSTGLILFLGFPIGAFCEIDEVQLIRRKASDNMKVSAAGIASNCVVALLALLVTVLAVRLSLIGGNEIITSLPFVVFLVNISLAIFNALPIGPLDGGRIFRGFVLALLVLFYKNRFTSESDIIGNAVKTYVTLNRITGVVSLATISLVALSMVIPLAIL